MSIRLRLLESARANHSCDESAIPESGAGGIELDMATTRHKSTSSSSRSTKAKPRSSSSTRRTSAHKTGRKTSHGQAWTDEHSSNPSSTGHGRAKKEPAKQTSRCWPGYEPVPGKKRGQKGSCRPKKHQTSAERKSDAMAAAATKLRKSD